MRRATHPEEVTSAVEVRMSSIHGLGVFATRNIRAATAIGKYSGKRYSLAAALRRKWDDSLTYLYELSDGTLIDGSQGGNATKHINHGCEPNCQAVEYVGDDGKLGLRIETTRVVRAGQELFLDYGLSIDSEDDPAAFACDCGSPRCRKTMVGEVVETVR